MYDVYKCLAKLQELIQFKIGVSLAKHKGIICPCEFPKGKQAPKSRRVRCFAEFTLAVRCAMKARRFKVSFYRTCKSSKPAFYYRYSRTFFKV